jgi:hypothetical protein
MKKLKFIVAVLIPFLFIVFAISERFGLWDHLLGLDKVILVAKNFETSYAVDACKPIRSNDSAWHPLMRLIKMYSTAKLPVNEQPKVFARFVAVSSAETMAGNKIMAEWTAPSTPISLIYVNWPGNTVPPDKYRIVGTVGDIREWVERYRKDFHLLVLDVFLSLVLVLVSFILWKQEE